MKQFKRELGWVVTIGLMGFAAFLALAFLGVLLELLKMFWELIKSI